MNLLRTYSYARVEKEDPDELKHRKAQFLIYKALEEAESRRKPSFPRLMMSKFKTKIRVRFMRMRKSTQSISIASVCVHQQLVKQLKLWKQAPYGNDDAMVLTPDFQPDLE